MPHWRVEWREWTRRAEQWLLPAACLSCGRPIQNDDEPLACDLCCTRWRAPTNPLCPRCGQPDLLNIGCRICADWPPEFGPVRSAVMMDPAIRRLLHQFKYHGWHRLAERFAGAMAPLMEGAPPHITLVPIPLAAKRLHQRGYNQAAVLAEALGRQTGLPVAHDRLMRRRETATQTRLAAAERRANLAGAFAARPSAGAAMLVDDVFMTGATLVSAADALLDAGASGVLAVTFARADPPLAGAARFLKRFDLGA